MHRLSKKVRDIFFYSFCVVFAAWWVFLITLIVEVLRRDYG